MTLQDANDDDIKMVLLVEPHDREYEKHNPTEYQKVLRKYISDNFSKEEVEKMSEEILRKTNLIDLWNFISKIYETDKKKVDETKVKKCQSVEKERGIIEVCAHSQDGTCICEET